MKLKRRFPVLLLVLALLLTPFCLPVSAADTSGTLPTGQTWNFDSATGTPTVTGKGELPDYAYSSSLEYQAPWKVWKDNIKIIVLSEGITDTGDCTFHQLKNLTQVKLPSTLKTIGKSAFSGAVTLNEVTIPKDVTVIGGSAFKDCKALAGITIPEGVITIGIQAFNGCEALASVTIPKSVTLLDSHAFGNCKKLLVVTIKGSPKLAAEPFSNTTNLKQLRFCGDLPQYQWDTLRSIAVECYYPNTNATWDAAQLQSFGSDCTWIPHEDPASIPFSENSGKCGPNATWSYANGTLTISGTGKVETIWWDHHAQSIQHLVIEDGITNIIHGACFGYANLKTAKIADSVTIIESSAFEKCTSLTSITLPKNLVTIEMSAFLHCSSLNEVKMGNKVTTLGNFAFSGTAITEITLPDSLTTLGNSVFNGCKQLKELHFPASLKKMGDYIITGCSALKTVRFYGDLPETTGMNYQGTYAVVYYPKDNKTWASENLPFLSGGFILRPYSVCSIDGHTYGGWDNIKEPSVDEEGLKERICSVCKHKDYATVPKLGSGSPTTTPPTPPVTEPSAPPATEPSTPPTTTEPSSEPTPKPSNTTPVPSQPVERDPVPKKNDTALMIGAAILAVALIGGGAAWFFLRKRK